MMPCEDNGAESGAAIIGWTGLVAKLKFQQSGK